MDASRDDTIDQNLLRVKPCVHGFRANCVVDIRVGTGRRLCLFLGLCCVGARTVSTGCGGGGTILGRSADEGGCVGGVRSPGVL